jgi:membrane-associated protein
VGAAILVGLAVLLHLRNHGDGFSFISSEHPRGSYLAIFVFIFGDAICPIFPGETTLNAASTLAAQGTLYLAPVIVAGALGAVVGDSTLYWIAATREGGIKTKLEQAQKNRTAATALAFMGDNAPILLIAGRFVPGMRFVVNATMGLKHYPYRRFLLWSAIGGTFWAVYTCVLAYSVATALAEFPLASIVISGFITTIALGAVLYAVRRQRRQAPPSAPVEEVAPSA